VTHEPESVPVVGDVGLRDVVLGHRRKRSERSAGLRVADSQVVLNDDAP
jgi:hypothetical protein